MYEFIQFPKLALQYKSCNDPQLKSQLSLIIHNYKVPSSIPDLPTYPDPPSFADAIDDLLNENQAITIDVILNNLPQYFIAQNFSDLQPLWARILQTTNNINIHCWIYVTQVCQLLFQGNESGLLKTIRSTYKKILTYKQKTSKITDDVSFLLHLVNVFQYFLNFKQDLPQEGTPDLSVLKQIGYLQEYLTVDIIKQLITKPFNEIEYESIPPQFEQLVTNCQKMQLIDFKTLQPDLDKVFFSLPEAKNMTFIDYFSTTLKLKWFLNLMSFTSKISGEKIKQFLGDAYDHDDIHKFVLLIGSLQLTEIGIGYDLTQDCFYNNHTSNSDLHYQLSKANHLLNGQTYSLILKNNLVNSIVD